jgi:hypothetical protein
MKHSPAEIDSLLGFSMDRTYPSPRRIIYLKAYVEQWTKNARKDEMSLQQIKGKILPASFFVLLVLAVFVSGCQSSGAKSQGVLDPYGEIMALSHQVIDLVLDRDLDGLQKLIHPDGYSHFTNAMGSLERGLDRHWRLPGVSRSNHFVDFKSIMFTPDMSRAAVEIRFMNVDWYVAEYAMEMYFRKHNGKWMLELDYSYIE